MIKKLISLLFINLIMYSSPVFSNGPILNGNWSGSGQVIFEDGSIAKCWAREVYIKEFIKRKKHRLNFMMESIMCMNSDRWDSYGWGGGEVVEMYVNENGVLKDKYGNFKGRLKKFELLLGDILQIVQKEDRTLALYFEMYNDQVSIILNRN